MGLVGVLSFRRRSWPVRDIRGLGGATGSTRPQPPTRGSTPCECRAVSQSDLRVISNLELPNLVLLNLLTARWLIPLQTSRMAGLTDVIDCDFISGGSGSRSSGLEGLPGQRGTTRPCLLVTTIPTSCGTSMRLVL